MKLGSALILAVIFPAATVVEGRDLVLLTEPDGRLLIVNSPNSLTAGSGNRVPAGPVDRREQVWPMVREVAASHGLDPNLVDLVIRMESGYNTRAVSRKGARGLMQLMPATAAMYGVQDVFDAKENVQAGVRYLRDMLQRYSSNLTLALAAYNAGPGAVDRYGGVPPFRETRNYVDSIMGAYQGRQAGVLAGGFGAAAQRGPPPRALQGQDGRVVITNTPETGGQAVRRRLGL